MKYWFFDGSDVIGPFASDELAANKSFGATSLICPEEFSDDGDHWQPAALFAELKPYLAKLAAQANETTASLDEELDSLLKERSPLAFDETPTDGPELEIPKKPSKPGPIENYFNNIKKEDLGDILGIPDPNDNSDMDLAHALAKQLEKTASTRRKQQEMAEAAAPAPDPIEQTHHVATATEVFGIKAPVAEPEPTTPTMPTLPPSTLPMLTSDEQPTPAPVAATSAPDLHPLNQQLQQTAPSATAPKPAENVPPAAQDKTLDKSSSDEDTPGIIPNPALLRAEKIEVNSVRARLKQTQEMKDFLSETQNSHLKRQYKTQRKIMVVLLAALAIMIALVIAIQFQKRPQATPATQNTPAATATRAQELLKETPTVVAPTLAVTVAPHETQEQKALAIVQNYPLSGNRGTLASYLNRIYQTQLSQGYTAKWGAEPLHQSTYIVKYQLTKTRKEPIIYVFQADVASNKLTGALNNISLDLVGKI